MGQDFVPADKQLRRKFVFFLIFSVLVILFAAPYMNDYLQRMKQVSSPDLAFRKSMLLLKMILGLVCFILVGTGIYSAILAMKVLKSGRFPPPGMKVIRDTALRTGPQAKMAAISLITLSCILIIFALFFLYWPYAFEKAILKKKISSVRMSLQGVENKSILPLLKGNEIEPNWPEKADSISISEGKIPSAAPKIRV